MIKLSTMGKAGKKPIMGLLGGMCSGKSTAAGEFARMGCAVIDADEIAHQLLDDENVRVKIVRVFGKDILDSKGRISRTEMANKVFKAKVKSKKEKVKRKGEVDNLRKLTGVLHPPVLAKVEKMISQYSGDPGVKAIVLDMPLLVEVGWEKRCDYIIFIDCKPSIRLERARKTGFFDADELKIRENLQISLDKKRRIADNIVDNNSDLSGLSKQIAEIFSSIMKQESGV
jgi:dephospho-CoA kinase